MKRILHRTALAFAIVFVLVAVSAMRDATESSTRTSVAAGAAALRPTARDLRAVFGKETATWIARLR